MDRGPSVAGFSNNVALGSLELIPEGVNPLFVFSGTGTGNGLYVDYLDLSQLPDYTNQIQINPNLVIYYAAASLGFTPPNGLEPEEYLDGQFDGHLRWVNSFAGPNSSAAVLINGQTVMVNKALRYSMHIDSDGDGIPNGADSTPFGGVTLTDMAKTNQPSPQSFLFSWQAAANTIYQVEYTTNLVPANWQPLLKYTNNLSTNRVVTILDTNAAVRGKQRFYRVGYSLP